MPDHPAAKLCRPGTVPAGPVPGAPCGWIRCSRNQCPTAPAPISTGKNPPRLDQQQKRKSQSERPTPPALAFLLPTARPDQHRRRPDQHREGPRRPRRRPARSARPGRCRPARWAADRPPDHLPGLLLPAGPRRRPDDPAALLPHPCQTYRQRQPPAASPPAPRRQPNAGGVRFST